jgi:hypothetical protein
MSGRRERTDGRYRKHHLYIIFCLGRDGCDRLRAEWKSDSLENDYQLL